jgi:hypothetical protein
MLLLLSYCPVALCQSSCVPCTALRKSAHGGCSATHRIECSPMAAYGSEVSTLAQRSPLLKSQHPGPCRYNV